MTSAILADLSRTYFEYKIITLPIANGLATFHANILSRYLIIAHLSDSHSMSKSTKNGEIW